MSDKYHGNVANDEIYNQGEWIGSLPDEVRDEVIVYLNEGKPDLINDDQMQILDKCEEHKITESDEIDLLIEIKKKYEANYIKYDDAASCIREILTCELDDRGIDLVNAAIQELDNIDIVTTIGPIEKQKNSKKKLKKEPKDEYATHAGKTYTNGKITVLCTGPGNSTRTFSGVVVEQKDPKDIYRVGDYLSNWAANEISFPESKSAVIITNTFWTPKEY